MKKSAPPPPPSFPSRPIPGTVVPRQRPPLHPVQIEQGEQQIPTGEFTAPKPVGDSVSVMTCQMETTDVLERPDRETPPFVELPHHPKYGADDETTEEQRGLYERVPTSEADTIRPFVVSTDSLTLEFPQLSPLFRVWARVRGISVQAVHRVRQTISLALLRARFGLRRMVSELRSSEHRSWLSLVATAAVFASIFLFFVSRGEQPVPEASVRTLDLPDEASRRGASAPQLPSAVPRMRHDVALSQEAEVEPSAVETAFLEAEALLTQERDAARRIGRVMGERSAEELTRKEINLLVGLAVSPRTYREGLMSMALMENQLGPDLLYKAMREVEQAEIAALASELLQVPEVRERASLSLRVAIDAFTIEDCDEGRSLLERAALHGDQRAFKFLAPMAKKTGCGEDGNEDCFVCLRGGRLLRESLNATNRRRAPF